MMLIYLKGDATAPRKSGNQIIAHICNDIGGWGKGFVMAISQRWPQPENNYRQWFANKNDFALGNIQLVAVEDQLWVANMIAQRHIHSENGIPPIRYEAIEQCLSKLAQEAKIRQASVHMPRIGCGLAGGKWEQIEPLIESCLLANNVPVYIYDRK